MTISIIPYSRALCFIIQYLYPLFETINLTCKKNRDTVSVSSLTQLLFYWIIFGLIITIEIVLETIKKIPFYYDLKIFLLLWLLLPTYSGSGYIYYTYIDKVLDNQKNYISIVINEFQTQIFNSKEFLTKIFKNKFYKLRKI